MTQQPRYANFHIIHPIPFSNPNRDDTGAPKTTTYGGTVRGRISSQADKRPSRTDFEGLSDADKTLRSKYATSHLAGKVHALLTEAGTVLDDKGRKRVDDAIAKEIASLTGSKDEAKATLVWLAEDEINALAGRVAAKNGADGLSKDDIDAVLSRTTSSLTVAAFGRMFANRADLQIEAAAQVAHAFTTHEQQVDLDYFTAVDELAASFNPDQGAGAGHLDVNEFHSGVFYRYFNINRDDLTANWQPLDSPQGVPHQDAGVTGRLAQLLESLVEVVARGREATASHQTLPAHVLVTFTRRGTTYAPAFETPVKPAKDGGYLPGSIAALTDYADKVVRVAGPDHRIVFSLDDPTSTTLPDVYTTVARWLAGDDTAI